MLRIAIPYGTLYARQLRQLARIADEYDRGYGHFTTRTNLQFNWSKLKDVPTVLGLLADVEMHCIQTSGNCIRNVTADQFAGVAYDEIEDPRPIAELIRQWSTLHPEFEWLGRKFKIAVSGATQMTAPCVKSHDVGVRIVRDAKSGEIGYEILVGGGLGRTPLAAQVLREFLPREDLLDLSRGDRCASIISTDAATTNTRRASKFSSMKSASRRSALWSRRNSPASTRLG